MRWFLTLVCTLACGCVAVAQPADSTRVDPAGHFEVYTGSGERADLNAIVSAMADADVVFLGEQHNDPTGHALELMLLEAAHRQYGSSREVVLGMEMFERDVQPVLDEYLAGFIQEQDFLKAGRPWSHYKTEYRPLIEYARENGLSVIASNVPSRYASLARRRGLASLDSLSHSARRTLPREPTNRAFSEDIKPPSSAYEAKFRAEMEEMGAHGAMPGMPGVDDMLVAQNLRDASMAYWIADRVGRVGRRRPLVIHVNGSFHSAGRLGIPEHLQHSNPGIRMLVVTMNAVEDIHTVPEPTDDSLPRQVGDFIILTDEALISDE